MTAIPKQPASPVQPKRTRFSKEFKLQAVELFEHGQKTPTELAMELGIRRNQLCKWRDQFNRPVAKTMLFMARAARQQNSNAKSSTCGMSWRG